jgi:hypothetical protein
VNRAADILAEWDSRAADSPAALQHRQRDHELSELRGQLRKARQQKRQPQDQVEASAMVIAALLAENAAPRERATGTPRSSFRWPGQSGPRQAAPGADGPVSAGLSPCCQAKSGQSAVKPCETGRHTPWSWRALSRSACSVVLSSCAVVRGTAAAKTRPR